MDLRLQGKRALVTGSSIGWERRSRGLLLQRVWQLRSTDDNRNVHTPSRQTSRRTAVGSLLSSVTLQSKVRHRTSRTARSNSWAALIFSLTTRVEQARNWFGKTLQSALGLSLTSETF